MSNYLDELKNKIKYASEGRKEPTLSPKEMEQSDAITETDVHIPVEKPAPVRSNENGLKTEITNKLIKGVDDKKFFLSQTIIKEITDQHGNYKEDVCPRLVYEKYITKNYRHVTEPMTHGIYGETLCLGSGARGQKVIDLPKHKKTGKMLTVQQNIIEQSQRFKMWCAKKGITIIPGFNTQVPIIKRFDKKTLFRTEIDIFPTPFLSGDKFIPAVIDLKFTADIKSEWGDYCWGKPEFIDHVQADATYWLLQDFDFDLNVKHNPHKEEIYREIFLNPTTKKWIENEDIQFIYFILGYKKKPLEEQVDFLKRNYREENGSMLRQTEFLERGRKTMAQLLEWHEQGWPAKEGDHCKNCPVNKQNGGYCDKAPEIKSI